MQGSRLRWESPDASLVPMLTVRNVRPVDLPVLWAMAVLPNLGGTANPSLPVPLAPASRPPAEFGDLGDPASTFTAVGGDFVVAEMDGHIVGMGGFRPAGLPHRAEVLRVRVHPARRRWGIGTALMAALESRATGRGFHETWLDTATNQPEAMAFYESLGYIEIGRERRPDWRWTLIYYLKRLAPDPDGGRAS